MSAVARAGIARYAYTGRHRSPEPPSTAVRSAALSAGVVAAVMVGSGMSVATASAAPDSSDPWYRLRVCESGNNYAINTGNGYYGAYQFNAGTWRAYGGKGLPHQNTPAEQDYRAKLLYRDRGWSPWPACSRKLGLRENPAYGVISAPPAAKPYPVSVTGPTRARLQAKYRISGTARPNSTVVVKVRAYGSTEWATYPKRVDAKGRWSMPWRARTDYRYVVTGGSRSDAGLTQVGTTAGVVPAATTRLAGGTAPTATAVGTARPRSAMVLYVRTPGGAWRTWQKFSTGSTGRWQVRVAAPGGKVQFFARASNGARSAIGTVSL